MPSRSLKTSVFLVICGIILTGFCTAGQETTSTETLPTTTEGTPMTTETTTTTTATTPTTTEAPTTTTASGVTTTTASGVTTTAASGVTTTAASGATTTAASGATTTAASGVTTTAASGANTTTAAGQTTTTQMTTTSPIPKESSPALVAQFSIPVPFDSIKDDIETFKNDLNKTIADSTGVDPSQITKIIVSEGSIKVEVEISVGKSTDVSPYAATQSLKTKISSGSFEVTVNGTKKKPDPASFATTVSNTVLNCFVCTSTNECKNATAGNTYGLTSQNCTSPNYVCMITGTRSGSTITYSRSCQDYSCPSDKAGVSVCSTSGSTKTCKSCCLTDGCNLGQLSNLSSAAINVFIDMKVNLLMLAAVVSLLLNQNAA